MAADTPEFLQAVKVKDEDLNLDNLDDLLAQLTAEELDELNGDFDPDNSLMPASERMKAQTNKDPTGPYNRKKLIQFLEKKAKEEKDWENVTPYVKKICGADVSVAENPWKPKEVPQTKEEEELSTEWDEVLRQATEEELVDLAAVLGFHGMLNQTQFYASENNEKVEDGFTGVAKCDSLKVCKFEPPNDTDVEESLQKIKDNDSSLKHLNLNNIKNISNERLVMFCEALKTNTNLENLEMASVAMTDSVAKKLAEGLKENKTLKKLNVESNFITGDVLVEIIKAINTHQVLDELRLANQKPEALGNKVETLITKLILENDTILKFGIALEFPDARVRVIEKIQDNNDQLRLKRVGKPEKAAA